MCTECPGNSLLSFVLFKAALGDYGWAPQRDSNGDSLSGAQLLLGTTTNNNEKESCGTLVPKKGIYEAFSFVSLGCLKREPWAPERETMGDSLFGAHGILGTVMNEAAYYKES